MDVILLKKALLLLRWLLFVHLHHLKSFIDISLHTFQQDCFKMKSIVITMVQHNQISGQET